MLVSESLIFMLKGVARRLKHEMAIGLPCTWSIYYLAWWIAPVPVSESLNFMPKGVARRLIY